MSVERCFECGRHVDTDFNVEGRYVQTGKEHPEYVYICDRCLSKDEVREEYEIGEEE